jgi:hypothetical protein
MSAADARLLARRNGCALAAAGVTMFSAGAAVPGESSAVLLLAGPLLVCVALVAVLRAWSLARRLGGSRAAVRPPLEDLRRLTHLPVPALGNRTLLPLTVAVAAAAAFVRDHGEHATASGALVTAGIEATAVVGCFVVFGAALGLTVRPRSASDGA